VPLYYLPLAPQNACFLDGAASFGCCGRGLITRVALIVPSHLERWVTLGTNRHRPLTTSRQCRPHDWGRSALPSARAPSFRGEPAQEAPGVISVFCVGV